MLGRGVAGLFLWLMAVIAAFSPLVPGVGAAEFEATPVASPVSDAPVPVSFPRDDGPHDAAIEWWYYTGHLFTLERDRYGFEFVVFKGRRGVLEGYVSHFAVTDNPRQRFRYDQRIVGGGGVSKPGPGFDLSVGDWSMRGANGRDALVASMPGYAIGLALRSEKPPVLHEGDGYIDYGNGTASYYYSRTRLAVEGTLTVDGDVLPVTGEAWMDHQWGDFETYQEGGWDWYALQLEDGTELMLYLIRDAAGRPAIVDGTLVAEDGTITVLEAEDFVLEATGFWTSPRGGTRYPSGWTVRLPDEELVLTVTPTLADQELDTTATTGVTYWEGEVTVEGTRRGEAVAGLGYVELTGYAPVREIEGLPDS